MCGLHAQVCLSGLCTMAQRAGFSANKLGRGCSHLSFLVDVLPLQTIQLE